ncbi:hypothetical protein [Salipaludibacillus sp. CF4.18]|uniref:hypothetical protein n=1 Tax=Salipaludibacillus sp. CF4.18 TaxID=3373081 RepID=UPI003EE5EE61
MAVNEVAGNIETHLCTYSLLKEWLVQNADAELIDIKYSADETEDMVLVIYRKEE